MPTTYNVTAKSGSNAAGFPAFTVIENVYDASKQNSIAADVVQILTIPAGTFVLNVTAEVETVDDAGTYDIGDGDTPAGWIANDTMEDANVALGGGAYAAAGGKLYAAADTIDIVPNDATMDTFKVRVQALCVILGLTT